ncbi:hypothetical protein E2C01_024281 [Portunus trituberculatus]|uniref:Uncharacterized protein n=1 Tax=Portunus trituberculatus TaxID=210409 RepID=A0A5B7ECD8_PORTR|nr:hypothetical protein [Portunus trituberculatus]
MAPQTSRVMDEEEDTRGGGGCFGWLCKLFRRKKRERRAKRKEAEPSLTPTDSDDVPSTHLQNKRVTEMSEGNVPDVGEERQKDEEQKPRVAVTWAEEVDEAEEKGLDKRRARRRALRAAMKASAENEAAAMPESRASSENEAASTTNSEEPPARDTRVSGSDEPPFMTSATRRRKARRKAISARIWSEARLAATTDQPSVWPSPFVWVYGSDGRPFLTTWEKAAYGAFHAQRHG